MFAYEPNEKSGYREVPSPHPSHGEKEILDRAKRTRGKNGFIPLNSPLSNNHLSKGWVTGVKRKTGATVIHTDMGRFTQHWKENEGFKYV